MDWSGSGTWRKLGVFYQRVKNRIFVCIKQTDMDLEAQKIKLAQYILSLTKESEIEKFNALMDSEVEIVGYTINGHPLTKEEYANKIAKSDKSIDHGKYTTHENLKKEILGW